MFKKKIIIQRSVLLYILLTLLLAIIVSAIYLIIYLFLYVKNMQIKEWIAMIAAIGCLFYFSYTFIRMARNRIILDKAEIVVPENWGSTKLKLQYQVNISYNTIRNISLMTSRKNSIGNKVEMVFVDMPYIVFECKDGAKKLVNVYYYSKKQVVDLIDEVISRASAMGNELHINTGTEMMSLFLRKINKH